MAWDALRSSWTSSFASASLSRCRGLRTMPAVPVRLFHRRIQILSPLLLPPPLASPRFSCVFQTFMQTALSHRTYATTFHCPSHATGAYVARLASTRHHHPLAFLPLFGLCRLRSQRLHRMLLLVYCRLPSEVRFPSPHGMPKVSLQLIPSGTNRRRAICSVCSGNTIWC